MKLLLSFIAAITGVPFKVRSFTRDVAFKFRMDGGIPGDVNRTHPVTITAELQSVANPTTAYGQACLIDAADANRGVRIPAAADDDGTNIYGVVVRPFPISQGGTVTAPGAASTLGAGAPPAAGVIDVIRRGFVTVKVPVAEAATPVKGGAVFVRCQNSPGADDPVGGFKAVDDAGNCMELDTVNFMFNGTADASGNVELCVKV